MHGETPLAMLLSLSILTMSAATLPPASAVAELACSGHQLLRNPRPQSSCSNVKPAIYASPDGALRALVVPVDVSLYATPDMESRIVIRTATGFSDMIEGRPTLSADFHFAGPHILVASTWKQQGSLDDKIPVTVNLEDAFAKLPATSD